jgi:hypothetical protein
MGLGSIQRETTAANYRLTFTAWFSLEQQTAGMAAPAAASLI